MVQCPDSGYSAAEILHGCEPMTSHWTAPVDIYCERLDASFWAEPVNAVTNLFFIMAAYLLYRDYKAMKGQGGAPSAAIVFAIAMVATIGVGSFLFHTFATRWALMSDIWPINIFMLSAVAIYLRQLMGCSPVMTALKTGAFLLASLAAGKYIPADFINGSGGYLPAMAMLVIFIYKAKRLGKPDVQASLASALVVFIVSLTLRSLDMRACEALPVGLHFMWHVLNSLVLYHVVQGMLRNRGFVAKPEKDRA